MLSKCFYILGRILKQDFSSYNPNNNFIVTFADIPSYSSFINIHKGYNLYYCKSNLGSYKEINELIISNFDLLKFLKRIIKC